MADQEAGSTVPRRQLGRYLRDLRVQAGITARAAARQLERSDPTLWRIENGHVASRSLDVEQMCRLYGASPEFTTALMALAKETRARGWWQAYGDVVPDYLDLYVGLEAAANRIDWYQSELVPGLLQTEGYARKLMELGFADRSEDEIARHLQVRMGRQVVLQRQIDRPTLRVALRESVLRTPVGGKEVMVAQIAHLIEASQLPNVALRVVPFSAGLQMGLLSGPFGILRFPINGRGEESEPPTVYAELYTGALYLDKPTEIAQYDQAFGSIWESALDEAATRELLRRAMEEL